MTDLNLSRNLAVRPRAGCFLAVFMLAGLLATSAPAQTFRTLHSFVEPNLYMNTNSDGADVSAGLVVSGGTLYGAARHGGTYGNGTVFAVKNDGTCFTNLHNFTATSTPYFTNSDGVEPMAKLALSGSTLYGTSWTGGGAGDGTVFAVNTDGTGFTTLHSFTPPNSSSSDGYAPVAGLILTANALFGTTTFGGSMGLGTVFAVRTDGTGFTNLHGFGGDHNGAVPTAGLILSGNTLYGTTEQGGSYLEGTVFAVSTNGSDFTTLHSFSTLASTNASGVHTNSDGASPEAGLILSGNTLYGTTAQGGSSGNGTTYAINIDGTGFTNLHSFTALQRGTNSDGSVPLAGLILSGNTLYGTAEWGGSSGFGTVFAVNTNGTGFTTLHSFTATSGPTPGTNSDGAYPWAGLILSNNAIYGTAFAGGSGGFGTVFSLSFTPQLTIIPSGANIILTWPTDYAGFDYTGYTLQSTTNLGSSAVWSTNSPGPVVVNGQNAVTNPISGTRQFYRLSQ